MATPTTPTEWSQNFLDAYHCPIDFDLLLVEEFRVLTCGHPFCYSCLAEWKEQQEGLLTCPMCRVEDNKPLDELLNVPTHLRNVGPVYFADLPETPSELQLHKLLHQQFIRRAKTIRILKLAASELFQIERTGAGIKVGGSVGGLVGTGMFIGGTIAALTIVGAPIGAPIAIAGAAVGVAGGLTVGSGVIAETLVKSKQLKNANASLNDDYIGTVRLRILLGRAARDEVFAARLCIPKNDAMSVVGLFGRASKFGTASIAFANMISYGVARSVATVGLHSVGIAISAVMIPIDLFQLVSSSIKIHRKEKSVDVIRMERLAHQFEDELLTLLIQREYQIKNMAVYDNNRDVHWLLITHENEAVVNRNADLLYFEQNHVVLIDVLRVGNEVETAAIYEAFQNKWERKKANKAFQTNDEEDDDDDDDDGYVVVRQVEE